MKRPQMSRSDSEDNYNITRVDQQPRMSPHSPMAGHKNKEFSRHIRYTYCCEKCKYPDKPNGKCCVCVVPRSQRRVKLGEEGCRTCGCRGCTKEDRYYFEQKRDGIKVVDTEGVNYRQHQRGKRRRSQVGVISLRPRSTSVEGRRARSTGIRGDIGRAVIRRRAGPNGPRTGDASTRTRFPSQPKT